MIIDNAAALSYSVQSNKGIYALLLGSGISRASGIPTGWEITLDLVRHMAMIEGVETDNPKQWYRDRCGKIPEYSEVLDKIASTPSERNQILRKYFEPSSEDNGNPLEKQPTKAHQAIAKLVQRGYIRVIITTNFDRLLESALSDIGIVPDVISTADQIEGAMPIIHSKCTIIKVNGDYMDTRIKNTESELSSYSPKMVELLSRIFDEFGLIICGWSGEWDIALKECIFSCKNRRFTYYWLKKGDLSEDAKRIIEFKGAKAIEIDNADSFFEDLQNRIMSLEELQQKELPLSIDVACTTLKRLLPEDKNCIKICDLITNECNKVQGKINYLKVENNIDSIKKSIEQFENIMEPMINLIAIGCYWGGNKYVKIWCKTYKLVYYFYESRTCNGCSSNVENLYKYPSLMLQYIITMVCIYGNQYHLLFSLLNQTKIYNHEYNNMPDYERLISRKLFSNDVIEYSLCNHLVNGNYYYPVSVMLRDKLENAIEKIVPKIEYKRLFDKAELFLGLNFWYQIKEGQEHKWAPSGEFACQWEKIHYIHSLLKPEIDLKNEWEAIKAGFWDGNFSEFQICLDEYVKFIEKLRIC